MIVSENRLVSRSLSDVTPSIQNAHLREHEGSSPRLRFELGKVRLPDLSSARPGYPRSKGSEMEPVGADRYVLHRVSPLPDRICASENNWTPRRTSKSQRFGSLNLRRTATLSVIHKFSNNSTSKLLLRPSAVLKR